MEQTNFSIRKCFEELRKESNLSLGLILLSSNIQDDICDQVEAQEKKHEKKLNEARREITALHKAIEKLKK